MKSFILFFLFLLPFSTIASPHKEDFFMPKNDLHLQDRKGEGNIDEEKFNSILDTIESHYADIVQSYGATLRVNRLWQNSTVNASASQSGTRWTINMYGGLARRPEVTAEGFALVACHELGHHLGGVVFYEGTAPWASSEGQSDYFATISCAKLIFADEPVINATFESILLDFQGGETIKNQCDLIYADTAQRHICYRSAVGGKSLGDLLSALGGQGVPQFDTPDTAIPNKTQRSHPKGQCRLDTYVAGALCGAQWDHGIIPGKDAADRNSLKAYIDAKVYACHNYQDEHGYRPACWFNARDVNIPAKDEIFDTLETELAAAQTFPLPKQTAAAGESILYKMTGTGDADLYVKVGEAPTSGSFDCRPYKGDSNEVCSVEVPQGETEVYAYVVGYAGLSKVQVEIGSRIPSKLCRDFNGGFGEVFSCFEDLSCRLIEDTTAGDDMALWCIDY